MSDDTSEAAQQSESNSQEPVLLYLTIVMMMLIKIISEPHVKSELWQSQPLFDDAWASRRHMNHAKANLRVRRY